MCSVPIQFFCKIIQIIVFNLMPYYSPPPALDHAHSLFFTLVLGPFLLFPPSWPAARQGTCITLRCKCISVTGFDNQNMISPSFMYSIDPHRFAFIKKSSSGITLGFTGLWPEGKRNRHTWNDEVHLLCHCQKLLNVNNLISVPSKYLSKSAGTETQASK